MYYQIIQYILAAVYFLTSSITTFDMRMVQAKRRGDLPADEAMPPSWVALFYWIDWIIIIILLFLNWKLAILIFIIRFILQVLPVLETIGNILMRPFKK